MGRHPIPDEQVRAVAVDAEDAFWEHVVRRFPQVTAGDLSPDAAIAFTNACREAIKTWLDENTPPDLGDGEREIVRKAAALVARSGPTDMGFNRDLIADYLRTFAEPAEESRPQRFRIKYSETEGGPRSCTRWLDAYSAKEAEEIFRKGIARTVYRVVVDPDPIKPTAAEVEASYEAAHTHTKGVGHSEALNNDWNAFTALLPTRNGWRATWEFPGVIRWHRDDLQLEVVATPDWDSDGYEEIVCDLRDEAGERLAAFGDREWFEVAWGQGGTILDWPKSERTVDNYMALVGPKLDAIDEQVAEYRNTATRMLQDAGFEVEGDFEVTHDCFCPVAEEVPGAWISVHVFVDQRDMTKEPVK